MTVRKVTRWLGVALIATTAGCIVASCGGAPDGSIFIDGGVGADSPGGGPSDATTDGHDGPSLLGNDGSGGDGSGCVPKTCTELGYNCGCAVSCGASVNCSGGPDCAGGDAGNYGCPAGEVCGANGNENVCGNGSTDGGSGDGSGSCTPKTCLSQGYDCGYASDGCGNIIDCSPSDATTGCTTPAYCGGGGYNACGTGTDAGADGGGSCTPTTCTKLGYNCGATSDGCGNILQCGTCTAPQFCGGGGYDLCGPTSVATCDGGATTLSGFVYDPANNLPIYNALVYVPVGIPPVPPTGVVPSSCGCTAPPAYVSAYTGIDGSFTLTNPPSGASVTVAVQLGKWQRLFPKSITACQANVLPSHLTLPSTRAEGNIPRFAVDTGAVDTMECVLLKMGIAQGEFVDPAIAGGVPTAAGRVHFYEGDPGTGINGTPDPAGGAVIDGTTPAEDSLINTPSVMNAYDVILFPCKGGEALYGAGPLANLINYGTSGGRFFTTHYSYVWLFKNGAYANTATWQVNNAAYTQEFTGFIDQTFATGVTLSSWLQQPAVGASTTSGQIPVNIVRDDFSAVKAPAQRWMSAQTSGQVAPDPKDPAAFPLHYTFDTPVGGTACGRGVFSDFHVEDASNNPSTGVMFPAECTAGAMTPQEKLLEFMLFDLTSCVSPPVCTPLTCASFPAGTCGQQGDGCGGLTADCGTCTAPQTCGGGGVPGQCGAPDAGSCQPETCAQQNVFCGNTGDGCGNVIQCGTCTPPQTCGGGGVPGHCGAPDAGSCAPKSCAQQGVECGVASDGCGNLLTCPACPTGQTCNTTTGQCVQNQ
jgi:hypothetical protein